jgi:hypothetical protein
MAKIYSPPEEVGDVPKFKRDYDAFVTEEKEWKDKLQDWCKKYGQGKYRGETIQFGVADGYAEYMVFKSTPLSLIHIPLGDGYMFPWAKRILLKDVKEMLARQKSFEKIFSG